MICRTQDEGGGRGREGRSPIQDALVHWLSDLSDVEDATATYDLAGGVTSRGYQGEGVEAFRHTCSS